MNTKLNRDQDWHDLARRADWSVEKLAALCGVSTRTMVRYFRKTRGQAPKVWLTEQRQQHALKMLKNGSSVKEVALGLGYRHANTFSREFKKHWGQCPMVVPTTGLKPMQPQPINVL